jgi:hypothetical protein
VLVFGGLTLPMSRPPPAARRHISPVGAS